MSKLLNGVNLEQPGKWWGFTNTWPELSGWCAAAYRDELITSVIGSQPFIPFYTPTDPNGVLSDAFFDFNGTTVPSTGIPPGGSPTSLPAQFLYSFVDDTSLFAASKLTIRWGNLADGDNRFSFCFCPPGVDRISDWDAPLACSRLYFSSDTTGIPTVTRDAAWDYNGGDHGMTGYVGLLKPSPASSRNGANSWQVGTIAVPLGFSHGQFFYELSGSGTLAGTVKAVMRAARNSGVGVTGSQIHQAQMVLRIVSSDGSTVRGTLVSSHEPVSADSTAFTSTTTSRLFPAGALWGLEGVPMSPVSYQDGDWVVVEYGTWTTVDGAGTGASIYQNDQSGAAGDLPEDETETSNLRSWIDFCTASGSIG